MFWNTKTKTVLNVSLAILFAVAVPVVAGTQESYEKYLTAQKKYLAAAQSHADQKTLESLVAEMRTHWDAYKQAGGLSDTSPGIATETQMDSQYAGLAAPQIPAEVVQKLAKALDCSVSTPLDTSLKADLEKLAREWRHAPERLAAQIKTQLLQQRIGARIGSGKVEQIMSTLQVYQTRQKIHDFVDQYRVRREESYQKMTTTSWFRPWSKLKAVYGHIKNLVAHNKARSTYKDLLSPEEKKHYVNYYGETKAEIANLIPWYRDLFYNTNLDHFCAPVQDPEAPYELIVYTISSPHGIDWDSPRKLFLSSSLNQLTTKHGEFKHAIGHVFMELRAPHIKERLLAGMTTTSQTEEVDLVTKHGYAAGVLTADLMGKLDDPKHLEEQLEPFYQNGQVTYIRYLVSREMFDRLETFFEEYKERGCDQHYGGVNRPRYGEGGGCSAFGVSFIEVGGFMTPEYERDWQIHLRIPMKAMGGPVFKKRVPVTVLLSTNRWATEDEPHAKISMWDPTLMHRWITNAWKKEILHPTGRYMIEKNKKALALVVDARSAPIPEEPMWLEGENPWRQHGYRYGKDPYNPVLPK